MPGSARLPWRSVQRTSSPKLKKWYDSIPTACLLRRGDIKFQEDKTVLADSAFFEVFDFPLLQGDPHTALREPFSIVLSETTAKKYFSNTNPMGQTLLLTDASLPVKVTGIMKDMPENTLLKADLLVSKSTSKRQDSSEDRQWGNFGMYSYLLLKPNVNAAALEKKFPAFLEKRDGKEMREQQMFFSLFLEPLTDVYLKTGKRGAPERGNMANVYIFSIVGAFILLIACINFINLTTARSTERAKEVGIRKVVGAERGQLTNQFLGESILQALIAFVLAVVACALLIPQFNFLAGKIVSTGLFLSSILYSFAAGNSRWHRTAGRYLSGTDIVLFPADSRIERTICHRNKRPDPAQRAGGLSIHDLYRLYRLNADRPLTAELYAQPGPGLFQSADAGIEYSWRQS